VARPLAVAITGGIGAGKSAALEAFRKRGAAVSSSDEVVHRLLREDAGVHAGLRERYGDRVFDADGAVDRGALADIVFADPVELAWLEGLLHPRVAQEYAAWLERLAALPDAPRIAVSEIPLLYETGGETRFDYVVALSAPEEVRASRTKVRRDGRGGRLLPEEEKLARADFAYVNDGTLEELDRFVASVLERITTA
jgi:dephospho-CoA kinase